MTLDEFEAFAAAVRNGEMAHRCGKPTRWEDGGSLSPYGYAICDLCAECHAIDLLTDSVIAKKFVRVSSFAVPQAPAEVLVWVPDPITGMRHASVLLASEAAARNLDPVFPKAVR